MAVLSSLANKSKSLFELFKNNLLKSSADKCHLLISSSENVTIKVSEYDARNSVCAKLLGVEFNNELNFENYIADNCSQGSPKIYIKTPSSILSSVITYYFGCVTNVWHIAK